MLQARSQRSRIAKARLAQLVIDAASSITTPGDLDLILARDEKELTTLGHQLISASLELVHRSVSDRGRARALVVQIRQLTERISQRLA